MEAIQQLWNGDAGRAWVDAQELLDRMFQPFEEILAVEAVGAVLDVGCGAGATTLAIGANCTGVDISSSMINAAAARGIGARFIRADAQTHPFAPASFDTIVSRFGVMFFADPVAAFTNLRRAARDNATCAFVTWRPPEVNPFMVEAERAVADLLPDLPVRVKGEPGQFGLDDRERIGEILAQAGWRDIAVEAVDKECAFPATELVDYVTRLGPVGRALDKASDEICERVIGTAIPAFDKYRNGSDIRFNAACWMVRARTTA